MSRRKKICVVAISLAEFGALSWATDAIRRNPRLTLQVLVAGAGAPRQPGSSNRADARAPRSRARSMAQCLRRAAAAFARLRPDIVLVAGSRCELLSVCSAALVMDIPVANISGGGPLGSAADDAVQGALTKLAGLHFPETAACARRIAAMGEDPKRVFPMDRLGRQDSRRGPDLSCLGVKIARILAATDPRALMRKEFHAG